MEYSAETQEQVAQNYATYRAARGGILSTLKNLVRRKTTMFGAMIEINQNLGEIRTSTSDSMTRVLADRRAAKQVKQDTPEGEP